MTPFLLLLTLPPLVGVAGWALTRIPHTTAKAAITLSAATAITAVLTLANRL